ncbi:hypothetical protein K3X13_13355 [Aliiroseovarius crassostreae]|uniref:hypothetical protein n=1 Tax=Aliiroseovarius crassostreae TaxID=154981 RepID=UPI002208A749|nr:hypothetical protein [Aliiroseovarius crassostreae]UWP91995.1 hypothetical protein K3X13_13355 [Aliiroseovarius crassostreae]
MLSILLVERVSKVCNSLAELSQAVTNRSMDASNLRSGSKLWRLMIEPRNTRKRANFVQVLYEKLAVSADFGLKSGGTFCTLSRNAL